MKSYSTRRVVALLSLGLLGACQARPDNNAEASQQPAGGGGTGFGEYGNFFMPIAGCAGIMEVKLGEIAAQRATQPAVKAYAARMVQEHGAINDEYRALMRRKGLVPPDTMMLMQRQKVDSLQRMGTTELDKRYVGMMVSDHKMAVAMFDSAYAHAEDAEYKEWLQRMIKVVRLHYQHALALRDSTASGHQHGAGGQ